MDGVTSNRNRFSWYTYFAWGLLAYTLPVIVWGAYVRATGSGAGCGNHWPSCDGKVLPAATNAHLVIEFSHRVSSGLVLPLTGLLFWWASRLYPRGHRVRAGAFACLLLSASEALVGAGLVLFKLVAHNESIYRVAAISAHLVNTFLLLTALAVTAWWSAGGPPIRVRGQGGVGWALAAGLAGALLIGITGAFTALVDTLFPAGSLMEGFRQDVAPTAHFLIRLRIWHPFLAVSIGLCLVLMGWLVSQLRPGEQTRSYAYGLGLLYVAQIGVGCMNLVLLTPIWMQMAHLLLADALWIDLVLLAASACAIGAPRAAMAPRRRASIEGTP